MSNACPSLDFGQGSSGCCLLSHKQANKDKVELKPVTIFVLSESKKKITLCNYKLTLLLGVNLLLKMPLALG
jgi:hypothetical protein